MSQEYELINYSEHGSVVDGVLYSCDFSDKSPPSTSTSTAGALTLDDITALGSGRRAEKARERLRTARRSLEDKTEAKRALEAALKLAVPASVLDASFIAEEMSKAEGLVTRMGLKRVAAETSVVSIPLAKTRKLEFGGEQKTTTSAKLSIALQDKSKATLSLTTQGRNGTKKTNNQLKNNSLNCHRVTQDSITKNVPKIKKEAAKTATTTSLLSSQISDSKSTTESSSHVVPERQPVPPKEPLVPCLCKRSASSNVVGTNGKGWEGTATLCHGSKLRFGCIQFVLSLSGRPGHTELVEELSRVSKSTRSLLNSSDQSILSN